MIRSKWFYAWVLAWALWGAHAEEACVPFDPSQTQVIDLGHVKTVVGPLATFNPCHASVRLDAPSFFAEKRGAKPPLVIIAHGGGGLGTYERDFARWMNQQGFATLVFDAFQMNGLTPFTDLVLFHMTNSGRQRMIYKATLGAYQWALMHEKVDVSRVFIQGLSNGGSVAINMAASVSPAHVRGVIAEGAPAAGIGFPDEIKVPLLLLYGAADNYGGLHAQDWMHVRGMPCAYNDHDRLTPPGFAQRCNRSTQPATPMPSPVAWHESMKAKGFDVRLELWEGGGHGMMFAEFASSYRQLPGGRMFHRSHGAPADVRLRLQQQVLEFMVSKL